MWLRVSFKVRLVRRRRSLFNLFVIFRSGKGDRANAGEELRKRTNCKKRDGATSRRILVKGTSGPEERFGSKEEHAGGDKKPVWQDEEPVRHCPRKTGQPGTTE